MEEGLFADALGDASLETFTFNAGTEASEALLSESIDATFIGPNPAINAFAKSDGAVTLVAGTTSGGASLVVAQDIDSPDDLAGKTLATPSLGNTQDVALRAWLADQGYETDETGGGDVTITPQENADTLTTFQAGDIQGAWVPEPWATRLVDEGGGKVLVDESDLWTDTDGQFVTTHLLVRTDYLEEHPANVKALIEGLLDAIDEANGDAPRPRPSPTTASRRSPPSASATTPSPAPGRTSSSPPTRWPPRCSARPTTPSRSGCSTRSSWTASTT